MDRIYAPHRALDSRRYPVATAELMTEFQCSRSTLHRTICHLRDYLGAPVTNVPGRGYFYDRLADQFELAGLWFRSEELEALLVMDQLLARVQPGVLRSHLEPLRNKVKSLLDRGVRSRQSFPVHRIRILRSHARHVATTQLVTTATAVVDQRQITFAYEGRAAGKSTRRVASPQRLVYYRDQWYLDCSDEQKHALRTFSVDRMHDIELLARPARDVGDDELDAALTAGYGLFAGPALDRARLVFTAERSRWVADERWHPEQVGRFLADGRYELTVPYSDERELVGEILRHGADVEVVEPAFLVKVVRGRLERAVATYAAPESRRVSAFDTDGH